MMVIEWYPLLCVFVPNIIWQIFNWKKVQKEYRTRHLVWTYIFMFYLYLAVYDAAGIGTIWDLLARGRLDETINIIPFNSEGYMTYILNIIMFMPLGFLLPLIWSDYRRPAKTVLVGFALSLTIEICQMFDSRVTDIDDLIMNTLGAAFGFAAWCLFHRMFPDSGKKAVSIGKGEPVYVIWLSVLGIWLLFNWRWYIKIL